MKKGQIRQIFIWIFILVLAASILFFGIKIIKNLTNLNDDVLLLNFFRDFDEKVQDYYYLDIGSSGVESFNLPVGVEYVCFVDKGTIVAASPLGFSNSIREVRAIENLIKNLNDNLFVVPFGKYQQTRSLIGHLRLYPENYNGGPTYENPICVNVKGGNLRVKLENMGTWVKVSEV